MKQRTSGTQSSGNLYPASSASLPKLPADAATIAQGQDGSKFNSRCSDDANLRSGSKEGGAEKRHALVGEEGGAESALIRRS